MLKQSKQKLNVTTPTYTKYGSNSGKSNNSKKNKNKGKLSDFNLKK